jgi:hypothetical protein
MWFSGALAGAATRLYFTIQTTGSNRFVPILRELCRGREGAGDARLASIRLLLLAWLVLSAGLPATAHAAPTPSPTIPPPARAPGIALSPSAVPHPTEASTPAPGVAPASSSSTARATAGPTRAATPTRTPPPPTVGSLPAGAPTTRPGSQPTTDVQGVSEAASASTDSASSSSPDACAAGDACSAGADDVEAPLDWREFVPTDIADHLATMDRAARESGCGVPWHLLAAISRVESDFGRNMATSSAGAIGYGQFLPQSWQAFGSDGNAYDYRDALPAIAAYLCQAGLARDPRAALFAYNHADWYVDMVLDLAVRYDRLAPGAPTPDVLNVSPGSETVQPLYYADGRDIRLQTRARVVEDSTRWLGVPFRGRNPGTPISASALETTTLAMLRAAFGMTADPPRATSAASDQAPLAELANRAWDGGLLPLPVDPPYQWSLADIRHAIERGQPVAVLLDAQSLPGHLPGDATGDQPVVVIGSTQTALVYSDPSFSSSLGYGLELPDADFLKAWQSARTPLQALAFTARPRPPAGDAHVRTADLQPVYARVLPTPTPVPVPAAAVVSRAPQVLALAAVPDESAPVRSGEPAAPAEAPRDYSWVIVLGAAVYLGGAFALRFRWRPARRALS